MKCSLLSNYHSDFGANHVIIAYPALSILFLPWDSFRPSDFTWPE